MTAAAVRLKLVVMTLAMSEPGATEAGRVEEVPADTDPSSIRIAGACETYAGQTRYHNVTLEDLRRASGASERRIRHAFNECYGVPPTVFLRSAALHEVRRTLLEGPEARDAVSRAASDFGFRHLSRFADQYRALFGELPSATVARRTRDDVHPIE